MARCVRPVSCWSGKGVKGSTGSRMRSAGRSPSTERVRIEAKRTLDALSREVRWHMAGCSAFVHSAMETKAAATN